MKSWLIGKDSDAGRDWGQEEKGSTEDEMAGWHHRHDAHKFEWTPGVGDEQGGLACWDSWGRKESDTTEWLNWTEPTSAKSDSWVFHSDCVESINDFESYYHLNNIESSNLWTWAISPFLYIFFHFFLRMCCSFWYTSLALLFVKFIPTIFFFLILS